MIPQRGERLFCCMNGELKEVAFISRIGPPSSIMGITYIVETKEGEKESGPEVVYHPTPEEAYKDYVERCEYTLMVQTRNLEEVQRMVEHYQCEINRVNEIIENLDK